MQPVPVNDEAPHLLIVDDDDRIRTLLNRFLTGQGYRVSTADNAAEARARLEGLVFDLIVLDVMMPGDCDRTYFANSIPLSPGIITSRTMISKTSPTSRARASAALSAVETR